MILIRLYGIIYILRGFKFHIQAVAYALNGSRTFETRPTETRPIETWPIETRPIETPKLRLGMIETLAHFEPPQKFFLFFAWSLSTNSSYFLLGLSVRAVSFWRMTRLMASHVVGITEAHHVLQPALNHDALNITRPLVAGSAWVRTAHKSLGSAGKCVNH